MKKLLIYVVTLSTFFACQKDDKKPDPVKDALEALQGKYLVCDSVKTTVNGLITKQVLGKGKGWDLTFGFYGNLELHSNPPVFKNYSYAGPDKIYYWTGSSYQTNQYYSILSATSSKLVLKDTDDSGKVYTEYFTAE